MLLTTSLFTDKIMYGPTAQESVDLQYAYNSQLGLAEILLITDVNPYVLQRWKLLICGISCPIIVQSL
jgi:hypothetical protein